MVGTGDWNPTILNMARIDTVMIPPGLASEFIKKNFDAKNGEL